MRAGQSKVVHTTMDYFYDMHVWCVSWYAFWSRSWSDILTWHAHRGVGASNTGVKYRTVVTVNVIVNVCDTADWTTTVYYCHTTV